LITILVVAAASVRSGRRGSGAEHDVIMGGIIGLGGAASSLGERRATDCPHEMSHQQPAVLHQTAVAVRYAQRCTHHTGTETECQREKD
jgi:hypothetical protein